MQERSVIIGKGSVCAPMAGDTNRFPRMIVEVGVCAGAVECSRQWRRSPASAKVDVTLLAHIRTVRPLDAWHGARVSDGPPVPVSHRAASLPVGAHD